MDPAASTTTSRKEQRQRALHHREDKRLPLQSFSLPSLDFSFTSCPDLQIYAVTPIPDYVDVLHMDRVPDRVKSFYRVNNVRKFRYDRPFHKGPKDKENEFKVNSKGSGCSAHSKSGASPASQERSPLHPPIRANSVPLFVPSLQSLWIERTTLTLTHSLPGISRWFEVERRELVSYASEGLNFLATPQPISRERSLRTKERTNLAST